MDERQIGGSGTGSARHYHDEWSGERQGPRPDQIQIDGQLYPRPVNVSGAQEQFVATDVDSGRLGGGITQQGNELHVPLVEERLNVARRQTQIGEARIHRRVIEEEQAIPVDVWRDELVVERHRVEPRQLSADEAATSFHEATLRIPLRGQEPVARTHAYVTGEVLVNRRAHTERRQVREVVRAHKVTVDADYEQARQDFRDHYFGYQWGDDTRSFEEVEPHYRWGWEVGRSPYYADRSFEEIEPALRHEYRQAGYTTAEWEELREEIRAGWERARG